MNVNIPVAQPINPPFDTWETEANQMGLQGEHRRLYKLLRDFHGFTRQQCITLRDQGYMTLSVGNKEKVTRNDIGKVDKSVTS